MSTPNVTITRCESDADYEQWRSVRIALLPYERCDSVEEMRAQARESRLLMLVHVDGELAGSGTADHSDSAGIGFAAPRVLPEFRRRGIGGLLLAHLAEHLASLGLTRVRTTVDDDDSLAFAHTRGFEDVDHEVEQTIHVADAAPLTPPPKGIEVALAAERPELWSECFERFGREALRGFALSTALDVSPERWQNSWLGDPMFLALADGEVVGCAGLFLDTDEPERAENALTAVRSDWRGRGLAVHLKLRTLAWAAEHGVSTVYTWTQDGNAAMRSLNERLGYATTRRSTKVARPLPL